MSRQKSQILYLEQVPQLVHHKSGKLHVLWHISCPLLSFIKVIHREVKESDYEQPQIGNTRINRYV